MIDILENIMSRKLATIQKIAKLFPIEKADKIEVALMENLDYECVVKKGEFKIGDLCCYFECDSILPERPEFEFMRERKFRVKIIKLRKQISRGLIMPVDILPEPLLSKVKDKNYSDIGKDLTEVLGVKKHDPQLAKEKEDLENTKTKVPKWLMDMWWFRWIYFKLNPKNKGSWPNWVEHTEEYRIQVCARLLMNHFNEEWYITEKIDGQSLSVFTYFKKVWGFKKKMFGVASRTVWRKKEDNSDWWEVTRKLKLKDILMKIETPILCQAENMGPKIQGNKYKLIEPDIYVFNLIVNGKRQPWSDLVKFCNENNLKTVPLICDSFIPAKEIGKKIDCAFDTHEVVNWMLEYSKGKSLLFNRNREGIILRLKSDPHVSFKVINPDFEIENKDE